MKKCKVEGCREKSRSLGFCKSHYQAYYYTENRSSILAMNRIWAAKHPDKMRQYKCEFSIRNAAKEAIRLHDYYTKNRQLVISRSAQWRKDNPERYKESCGRHRLQFRDLINYNQKVSYHYNLEHSRALARVKTARWRAAHPDRALAQRLRRIGFEFNAIGFHTKAEWDELVILAGGLCPSCHSNVEKFTVDHIVPLRWGGTDYIWNIQPLCLSCNCSKQDRVLKFQLPLGAGINMEVDRYGSTTTEARIQG
jgi:hypothetical protein